LTSMLSELKARYDLEHLEDHVLDPQRRRQLVADALKLGTVRHWDFDPEPEHGDVRGDLWSAVRFSKSPAADRAAAGPRRWARPARRRSPAGGQRVNSFGVGRVAGHTLRLGWHDSQ